MTHQDPDNCHQKGTIRLVRDGHALPDPAPPLVSDTRAAHDAKLVAEERDRAFRLDQLSPKQLQNVMQSIEEMGNAQLRRFGAAGIVSIVFDSSGMSAMAIVRPPEGGVTDDYILGALRSITEEHGAPEPKAKRGKKR